MKRVLVTGSAGFAGSHFVDHVIANTDWDIVGLDSFAHRGDSLRVYQDPSRYKVYTHDLTTPVSTRLIDKIGAVDFIVNMASQSHVQRSIDDPVPFWENNTKLIVNILEYARTVNPKSFIQISTDEVVGPSYEGHKHKEWATPLPSNVYAASKSAQESLAIAYWRTWSVPVSITRTMNMFGARQDTEKFVPMLIRRIQRGELVQIHGTDAEIGSRHWLHSRNHADAILWLLNKGNHAAYKHGSGIDRPDAYNVVGEKQVSNLEMGKMISEILRKPLKYEVIDHHFCRPGHDLHYGLDGGKMADLGWKAPVELESSLRATVHFSLDHSEWLK